MLKVPAVLVAALLIAPLAAQHGGPAQQGSTGPGPEDLSLQLFLQAVETAVTAPASERWTTLLSPNSDRGVAIEVLDAMSPEGVSKAVVRERDRVPLSGTLPGEGFSLIADVFTEIGSRGRITTWRLDVRRPRDTTERQPWRLVDQERLSTIDGLHRLALHSTRQFTAKDLVVKAIDFELRLPSGELFVAETAEGVTAVILLGEGSMHFTPAPAEERGQVRLYAGTDRLETPFTAAFVRLNPYEFDQQIKKQVVAAEVVDTRALRRAQTLFDEEVGKSFSLDLRDLSRDNWSLLPQPGDFLSEVRTRRFGTLTYARSTSEAEDITLFHRERQRNISAYASETKLSSRGRFFDEDDLVEYDVLDYAIDANFYPEREWLDGRVRMTIRVKSYALAALTLRLADEFVVSSINCDELGRLMFLRVKNQNNVVVNLPSAVPRDVALTLHIDYAGRIQTQALDQETLVLGEQVGSRAAVQPDLPYVPPETNWLFSNRSHWYPQNQVTDYATATVRFSVPADYRVIASGLEGERFAVASSSGPSGSIARTGYTYEARQPLRYIGIVISRFVRVDAATVALDIVPPPLATGGKTSAVAQAARAAIPPLGSRNTVALAIDANRRQQERGRDLTPTAAEILRLYASLIGDVPYDGMTIAMVEHDRPGGHSPAYFAVLNNPLPVMPWGPRHDPASFTNFPEFYIAHEIAHQWFGQAVGWKNYHEQWLSEGFAQYFAALYAKERRGEQAFRDVIRQFRRWAMDQSDQGAVYLGYRLGHIKNDSRVFRALVYNKGAAVLHMLRRFVGDDVFFRGLRHYYAENRFTKAGTEDLQRAMEAEAGRSLERFFERWIYESGLPRVRYSTAIEGQELVVRFEQSDPIYDLPVTVTVNYGDTSVDAVVTLSDATTEKRLPLTGPLRGLEVNADHAALGTFEKKN